MTSDPFFYGILKQYANVNRYHQTDAEQLLWFHLSENKLGLHFRRQHVIGCYIADFVCLRAKTIIEVDGGYHAQELQQIQDYWRTEDLQQMGYDVLRFKNEDITTDISNVLDKIFNHIVHKL